MILGPPGWGAKAGNLLSQIGRSCGWNQTKADDPSFDYAWTQGSPAFAIVWIILSRIVCFATPGSSALEVVQTGIPSQQGVHRFTWYNINRMIIDELRKFGCSSSMFHMLSRSSWSSENISRHHSGRVRFNNFFRRLSRHKIRWPIIYPIKYFLDTITIILYWMPNVKDNAPRALVLKSMVWKSLVLKKWVHQFLQFCFFSSFKNFSDNCIRF